jgi:hypothetical protein
MGKIFPAGAQACVCRRVHDLGSFQNSFAGRCRRTNWRHACLSDISRICAAKQWIVMKATLHDSSIVDRRAGRVPNGQTSFPSRLFSGKLEHGAVTRQELRSPEVNQNRAIGGAKVDTNDGHARTLKV